MGHAYKPQLDGVRAFCIIFTIFNHIPGTPAYINGSSGVDIFFALSGWLITWLLTIEYASFRTIALGDFYIRRIFRILPLYVVVLIAYALLAFAGAKRGGAEQMAASLPYLATFNSEYRPPEGGNIFGHAWTLGIEEKFYLIWPLILSFTIRRLSLAFLCALGVVALLMLAFGASPDILRGYLGLSFGATMAIIVSRHPRLEKMLRDQSVVGILLMAMAIVYLCSIVVPLPAIWNIAMALVAAPMIANLWFRGEQPVGRFLSLRFLAWVGRLTYAIYLVQTLAINLALALIRKAHLPAGPWLTFAVAYAVSILIAWGLHVSVEKPMIRLGKRVVAKRREQAPAKPIGMR